MAEANQIIFIEAFLASKKIKLTLFLQALFKALKTTITFWCFVFVTLFNLQGTRCVPQRFLMISLRFPFVKNFFRNFSASFKLSHPPGLEVLSPPPSQATYLGYHTQFALSRTFSSFSNFFQVLSASDLAGKNGQPWLTVYVGITYLSGPSPGKYFRQKRA